jgi:hypothetical protein
MNEGRIDHFLQFRQKSPFQTLWGSSREKQPLRFSSVFQNFLNYKEIPECLHQARAVQNHVGITYC